MDKFRITKTTFILTNNIDEKEIPISISENIEDFQLIIQELIHTRIDSVAIKNTLGLESEIIVELDLPMVFQINFEKIIDSIYKI